MAHTASSLRRGDGRAQILDVQLIGEDGKPTGVFRTGELAVVRVSVKFEQSVADPVIGILIRTRIGLNVYGTNTELEKLKFGPCSPAAFGPAVLTRPRAGIWMRW